MFLKKGFRKADKAISKDKDFVIDSKGDAVINIKATTEEQIFSAYNYDSNENLNDELGNFILDKAKFVPLNTDIKIKLYTKSTSNENEVKSAIKNHFKKEYMQIKNEKKKNLIFSFMMFVLGLLSLTFLLLMHTYFYNVYLDITVEIATWVFIWEAVDSYFLERTSLKRESITLLKIYTAEIEVIKLKNLSANEIKKKKTF